MMSLSNYRYRRAQQLIALIIIKSVPDPERRSDLAYEEVVDGQHWPAGRGIASLRGRPAVPGTD